MLTLVLRFLQASQALVVREPRRCARLEFEEVDDIKEFDRMVSSSTSTMV